MTTCPCSCRPLSVSPPIDEFARRVVGTEVVGVRRLAKRAVIDLSSKESIVIEPRMTGLLLLADPPDPDHLRLEWRFERENSQATLWFWDRRGLGVVRLLPEDELLKLVEGTLGRDALAMSLTEWTDRFRRTRREIKVVLLDQSVAAGIGNLYASEILHRAGVSPRAPAASLKPKQIEKLHLATQEILNEAILLEGSTLGDTTYRTALNINGRYQSRHRVYKKAGERCATCAKATIERIVQSQRSTFFCPRCQK